jgi:hypothetical protein
MNAKLEILRRRNSKLDEKSSHMPKDIEGLI